MANEVKFTEDELQKLQTIQTTYQNLQTGFGQFRVQRMLLEQQMNSLDEAELGLETDYTKAQENEREFVKSLNDKYGPGSLDPATGVFTPAPTATTEEATGAPK
jgi:DNA repair exonuclease SbcCD ATPase subunit